LRAWPLRILIQTDRCIRTACTLFRSHWLDIIGGMGVTWVGDKSRIVKIYHNALLSVVKQTLAEPTVLAQKSAVPLQAFLDFINYSVMGSDFLPIHVVRMRAPGLQQNVHTRTPAEIHGPRTVAGQKHGVPTPTASATWINKPG